MAESNEPPTGLEEFETEAFKAFRSGKSSAYQIQMKRALKNNLSKKRPNHYEDTEVPYEQTITKTNQQFMDLILEIL